LKTYKSISGFAETELIIKHSRFIGEAYPLKGTEGPRSLCKEAKKYLAETMVKYKDATHYCYAYIIDDGNMRASDDGEPQGTAGAPILSVLKKRNLHKTLVIVTRYYGGVNLGRGGLVSAYTAAASAVLDIAGVKIFDQSIIAKIKFGYELEKIVEQIIKKYEICILGAEYHEAITFEVTAPQEKWQEVKNTLAGFKIQVESERSCWL